MSWLKTNRWYLVALAVLAPAALLIALSAARWSYVESANGRPISVSGSETVDYAGAEWSLLEWHSFSAQTDAGRAAALLPGTTLVTATLGVRPGANPPSCDVELTDTAGERSWPESSYTEADFEIADSAQDYCDSSAEGPYKVQFVFVVPDDAADHPRLRLSVLDQLPTLLSFEL